MNVPEETCHCTNAYKEPFCFFAIDTVWLGGRLCKWCMILDIQSHSRFLPWRYLFGDTHWGSMCVVVKCLHVQCLVHLIDNGFDGYGPNVEDIARHLGHCLIKIFDRHL